MIVSEDFALLLTATIDIQGMPKAYPTKAQQREQDYYNSLSYYISNHPQITKIVFVENSGWPLEKLQKVLENNPHNKQVEFISLNCNNFPRYLGKGYGESLLIEQGVAKSELIKNVNYIAKITGRLFLINLTHILEKTNAPFDCICDFKDQGYLLKRLLGEKTASPNCDTRFLVFTKKFYHDVLQNLHKNHTTGNFYFELQYYSAIKKELNKYNIINRFPIEPNFRGIAGHFGGKNYGSNKEKVKYYIRSILRYIIPSIHL